MNNLQIIQDKINATFGGSVAERTKGGPTPNGSTNGAGLPEQPPQASALRVYILGPMRGIAQYNFPAFDAMEVRLRNAGFDPINPAALDRAHGFVLENVPKDQDWTKMPEGMNIEEIVLRDLKAVLTCGAYVALPGFERSKGATAEKGVLDWRGARRLDPRLNFCEYREDTQPFAQAANGIPAPAPKDDANPKDLIGMKKAPLRLVPWVAVIALARVMALGAKKYGEANWRDKKPRTTVYIEAALRHILAFADGQDIDPESGESHLAHVMANMAILLDAGSCGSLLEDRKTTGEVVKALNKSNA